FDIADHVILVNKGRIEQEGSPQDILDSPATEFAARFFGDVNIIEATVAEDGRAHAGAISAAIAHDTAHAKIRHGARVRLVVRSYDVKFWRDDAGPGTVRRLTALGDRVRVEAEVAGAGAMLAHFPRRSCAGRARSVERR